MTQKKIIAIAMMVVVATAAVFSLIGFVRGAMLVDAASAVFANVIGGGFL
ncbi:type II secretory pathway pseudopilin PulG [Microbacterium halimionae]|uniref:Type II secretory pathway pseudopilin PulG n=1 Tax=Microbacterium halimionae TaxID=1526413 RepID=A0A7W3JPU5_9MICO|nr:hypothetical protein [Microbacterium halimionae]MBA8816842.1 type II secretory pathway pseudopilin PulG [Microbacterium halimionae]NII94862.1 type II secretory pathway pseudopilin PulG [Microbacterium halimionae]